MSESAPVQLLSHTYCLTLSLTASGHHTWTKKVSKYRLSCLKRLSTTNCPACPGLLWLPYPGFYFPAVLSNYVGCPIIIVQNWKLELDFWPPFSVMIWSSCAALFWLSLSGCPFLAVMFLLSCSDCLILDVLFCRASPGYSVLAVRF
jgi:hypothetical protein